MSTTTLRPVTTSERRVATRSRQQLAAYIAAWRYVEQKRDLRFDLLRGCAVFAMVVDHIGGEASWLYHLTGGNTFYTSAAEGFVFISGLVFGLVYAAVLARDGLAEAMLKAFHRAGLLYFLTVTLTFVTAALALRFELPWAPDITATSARDFVIAVTTLHRTFYMTDILLLYTIMVTGAAVALVFFSSGRTWLVLAASWGLWALWQLDWRYANFLWPIEGNEIFHLAAWQVLFFTGLAIGYHRRVLARRFGWLTGPKALLVSGLLLAWLIALYRAGLAGFPGSNLARVQEAFTYKPNVGPGRLLAFAILAVFAVSLLTTCWRPVSRATGWLLLPLGQHALFAYSAHLFVLMATTQTIERRFPAAMTAAQNTVLQLAGVAAIWLAIVAKTGIAQRFRRASTPQTVALTTAQAR